MQLTKNPREVKIFDVIGGWCCSIPVLWIRQCFERVASKMVVDTSEISVQMTI